MLVPHSIVMRRNENRFLEDYDRWKSEGGSVEFDTTCRFDRFVSIDSFGSSGSSAVMDLLREYDCCTVWATKPRFTASRDCVSEGLGEMNLMRISGGLLYLEKMMAEDCIVNVFWVNEAVKAFMALAYRSEQYKREDLRPLFFGFLDRIIYQRLSTPREILNCHLNPFNTVTDIFYLRRMPREEYYTICREFLFTLFNRIFPEAKGGCLVLDHIFDDCGPYIDHFRHYLPGIRCVKVKRDIRDVYYDAVSHDYRWLAHDTVEDFVRWEKNMYHWHRDDSDQYLTIAFENLIDHYDEETARLERYLGLDAATHTKRQQLFNPQISRKNVRRWLTDNSLSADCERIKAAAPELCY